MSRKGNCLDNSIMESFFGTLKNEFFYNNTFNSIDEFKIELDKYINYYNNDRIKYRLNGLSPVKYNTELKPYNFKSVQKFGFASTWELFSCLIVKNVTSLLY